jgi:hypothetical protein
VGAAGDAKCRPALWVRSGTYALGQLAARGAVASGSCGVPRPSLVDYVSRPKATRGAIAARRVLMLPSMKRLPVSIAFRQSIPCSSLEVASSFYSRSEEGEAQLAGA